MGITVTGFVFYGVALEDDDEIDGAWPEPYTDGTDVVGAYLQSKLGRKPEHEEERAFDPPGRSERGDYWDRDEANLSLVTTLEGGYLPDDVRHPYIAIRTSYQQGDFTGALSFDPDRLRVDDATLTIWRDALREFCDLAKLPWREPGWYIAAVME